MQFQDQLPLPPNFVQVKSHSLFNRFFKWNYGGPKKIAVFEMLNPFLQADNPAVYLQNRLNEFAQRFHFPQGQGEQKEYPDRLTLTYKSRVLQVYKDSDAVWFYDRDLVAPTGEAFANELPSAGDALMAAETGLVDYGVKSQFGNYLGIDHTVAIKNGTANSPEVLKTEIRVHYGFQLNELPVFGPGAKLQFGFVKNDTELSELIYFWREPKTVDAELPADAKKKTLISPRCALWKLAWRKCFFKLIFWNFAKIRITGIDLGYYASPPFRLQSAYIPVYRITGTIQPFNKPKQRQEFFYFVSAARLTTQERVAYGWPFTSKTIIA